MTAVAVALKKKKLKSTRAICCSLSAVAASTASDQSRSGRSGHKAPGAADGYGLVRSASRPRRQSAGPDALRSPAVHGSCSVKMEHLHVRGAEIDAKEVDVRSR